MSNDALPNYPGKELEAMSFAENYHRWIIDEIEPYLGETVAEVGAGIGSVSRLLLRTRIRRLRAFEPSQNMYPFLAEALRQEARAQAVNDFFRPMSPPQDFDSVVYINILEHVEDDRAELANAHVALKPNGHVVVFVPALNMALQRYGRAFGARTSIHEAPSASSR